jgi:hypothetical protein
VITVPAPTLAYDALAPGVAPLELPLTVQVGAVLGDDAVLTPVELTRFELLPYRRLSAGALTEIWDTKQKTWVPEGDPAEADPFAFLADQPVPWQGLVVAAGGTDAAGQPQYAKALGGFPSYTFRAMFSTTDEVAVSASSPAVSFAPVADKNLMVMGPGDGEKPDEATEARVLLKNPALATIGGLVVHRDSPGAEVTLSNAAGASVVLRPDGSIRLRPGPGRSVVVDGDLETGRITYQPGGGGVRVTLP